jgi:hypothetical protein
VGLGTAERSDYPAGRVIIFRQLPLDALWVIGLLVGLEMLFNGWTWIMLAGAIHRLPRAALAARRGQLHVFGQPFFRKTRLLAEKWTSPRQREGPDCRRPVRALN